MMINLDIIRAEVIKLIPVVDGVIPMINSYFFSDNVEIIDYFLTFEETITDYRKAVNIIKDDLLSNGWVIDMLSYNETLSEIKVTLVK